MKRDEKHQLQKLLELGIEVTGKKGDLKKDSKRKR